MIVKDKNIRPALEEVEDEITSLLQGEDCGEEDEGSI